MGFVVMGFIGYFVKLVCIETIHAGGGHLQGEEADELLSPFLGS